jgi:hypothetical protein
LKASDLTCGEGQSAAPAIFLVIRGKLQSWNQTKQSIPLPSFFFFPLLCDETLFHFYKQGVLSRIFFLILGKRKIWYGKT